MWKDFIDFNQKLDSLPKTLKKLRLGFFFNQSIDNIPDSIEFLMLRDYFTEPITKLPKKLKELYLPYYYEHSLPQYLLDRNFKIKYSQPMTIDESIEPRHEYMKDDTTNEECDKIIFSSDSEWEE